MDKLKRQTAVLCSSSVSCCTRGRIRSSTYPNCNTLQDQTPEKKRDIIIQPSKQSSTIGKWEYDSNPIRSVHPASFLAKLFTSTKVGIKSAAATPKVKPQLLTAGDTLKNDNCEWGFYFWCCECPTFCLDTGKGGGGMIHVSRAPVLLLLRNLFVLINWHCQFPHIATVWHILWGAVVGTQMLHATGVSQCDSSCFVFSFEGGRVGARGGSVILNLNFQVEEAGRRRNKHTYTPLLPLEGQKSLCTHLIITGGRPFGIVTSASFHFLGRNCLQV